MSGRRSLPALGFIGAGRLGCALAWHCKRLGYPLAGVSDNTPGQARLVCRLLKLRYHRMAAAEVAAAAEVVFFTTPDSRVKQQYSAVSRHLKPGALLVHCAGALGAEIFEGAGALGLETLALHPVQTFASHIQAVRCLPGSYFALDGTRKGLGFGRRLVRLLGGRWFRVAGADRPLYHAMCVFSSNFLNASLSGAESIGALLGLGRVRTAAVVAPLARTTLENIMSMGASAALTGPVPRGDTETLAAHVKALQSRAPSLLPVYEAATRRLIELAGSRDLCAGDRRRLLEVLG